MPDFWTHIMCGDMILQQMGDESFKKLIKANRKYFNFGCQGPDFFFYNNFWPWLRDKTGPKAGNILHEKKTKALIVEMAHYLKSCNEAGFPLAIGYLSGFMAHYVIDKRTHPFIYERTSTNAQHKLFELKMDAVLIKKYWDKEVHKLSPVTAIDIGSDLNNSIVECYSTVFYKIYNIKVSRDTINESYRDMKKAMSILYSPFRVKKYLCQLLDIFLPVNVSLFFYESSPDENFLSADEFDEFEKLLSYGVLEGSRLVNKLKMYFSGQIPLDDFASGLNNISFTGKQY